jgi:hypothetical protein
MLGQNKKPNPNAHTIAIFEVVDPISHPPFAGEEVPALLA